MGHCQGRRQAPVVVHILMHYRPPATAPTAYTVVPTAVTGCSGHVPGITGHVRPEYPAAEGIGHLECFGLGPARSGDGAQAVVGRVLERTVRELQGMSCIDLDDQPSPKKDIACTRSFGEPVTELQDLEQAACTFSCMAAQKLRKQASCTMHVLVFIHTSPC